MKWFWYVLPLIMVWVLAYAMVHTLPETPFESWWGIPLFITYTVLWLATVVKAISTYWDTLSNH